MNSLEFMHRLAALVPRPRLHLIRRSTGVLASNAKLHSLVVPQGPPKGRVREPPKTAVPSRAPEMAKDRPTRQP